mgnify:CR=1 FL=1
MPRRPRICFPGAVYHIYQRGNDKQDIFLDDFDRWHFLKLLLEAKKAFRYLIYCYVLMNNHFHMTVETPNEIPISKIMQFTEGSYATYFNKRHDRKGHLFEGRFNDIIVEKDSYLLQLSRYVHLNPVRAGLVALPEEYGWSSFCIYLGRREDILVDTDIVLQYFDSSDLCGARGKYKNFVEEKIASVSGKDDWLENNLVGKKFLGSSDFIRNFRKGV